LFRGENLSGRSSARTSLDGIDLRVDSIDLRVQLDRDGGCRNSLGERGANGYARLRIREAACMQAIRISGPIEGNL